MRVPVAAVAIALIILTALVPLTVLAQNAAPGDQEQGEDTASMFLHDATHTGGPPDALTVPLVLNWKHTVEQRTPTAQHLVSTPVSDGDSVYFFVSDKMYAVSAKTGAAKWDKPLDVPAAVDSTPVIKDGMAAFGCRNGVFYFVELGEKAGKIVGEFNLTREHTKLKKSQIEQQLPTRVQSSPLYHDGVVFFGGSDGWIYAINLETQEKIWDFRTRDQIVCAPAYWNHGIYVASLDGCVYGLSEKSGRLIWKTTLENKDLLISPVVSRSKVFVAAGKYLYACDHGAQGYVRMRFEAKGEIIGAPAITGDRIIVADDEGKVYALDIAATGNISYWNAEADYLLWQVPEEESDGGASKPEGIAIDGLHEAVRSAPVVAGDAVICRSGPRKLNALSIEDGTLLWHYDLSELAGQETTTDQEREAVAMAVAQLQASLAGGGTTGGAGARGMSSRSSRTRGGSTMGGRQTSGSYSVRPIIFPTMVFEQVVMSGASPDGDTLYVLGNDGALYSFSTKAGDAVPPEFTDAEIEIPSSGQARSQQRLVIAPSVDDAAKADRKPKIRGALPIYVRLKAFDAGCGIDTESINAQLSSGDAGARWEAAYDAKGTYIWAICETYKGSRSRNLPDGDYVLTFTATDWSGNQGAASAAFTVDNSISPAKATPQGTRRGRRGRRGGGMPGEMMGPGGMPGGMMGPGGMPGGMMGPGGGMPGMPGGGGMPGMP